MLDTNDLVLDPGNPRVHKISVGSSPYDASYSDYVHALGPIFSVLMGQLQDMDEGATCEAHRKRFAAIVVETWLGEWGDESERLETSGQKRSEGKELISNIIMESTMSSYLSTRGLQPALDYGTPWEDQLQSALDRSQFTQWKEPEFARLLQPPTVSKDPAVEALRGLSWEEGVEKLMRECRDESEIQREKEQKRREEEIERQAQGESWFHLYR
ncbi:hypothetical protein AAF712_016100 [Marasmius tenuissimus]|uniref:Uncharacterized protein n=1 Tax=Marasmius tenuissimus TaxID=585030 RepID=A0ABR2Z7L6_9AGAR